MSAPGDRAKAAIERLAALLAERRTVEVAGRYFVYSLGRANDLASDGPLVSPARQGDVLLSVLVSTPEPESPQPFGEEEWSLAVELLNEAFMAYAELFWPTEGEISHMSEEWARVREVAMPTFLHYHNTGLIASPEQVTARIRAYIVPFDDTLEASGMPSATSALDIVDWVWRSVQDGLNAFSAAGEQIRALQSKFGADIHGARAFVTEHRPELPGQMAAALNGLGIVRREHLTDRFGEAGVRFWDTYSIERGAGETLLYPTEEAVTALRPMMRLSPSEALVPAVNSLFTAILSVGERCLLGSESREAYLAHRDVTLEKDAATQLGRIISSETIHRSVFETPDSQKEHDVVIIAGDAVFIAEAKASPPTEPFRDPDRAFTRLRRSFRAETGIQKGFEQAESIRHRLDEGEAVALFDKSGNEVALLDPTVLHRRYSIVVTRDDFGPLATNLKLLLEKSESSPYPWVVNALDLQAVGDAWEYLQWGTDELEEYLQQRMSLHGKVISTDELEILGFYIEHKSLTALVDSEADFLGLSHHYSDFFDALYLHRHHGTPAPQVLGNAPVVTDLREALRGEPRGSPQGGDLTRRTTSVAGKLQKVPSRNARCPCGSGKRFRKCCGRGS